jgi:hypothetical protein
MEEDKPDSEARKLARERSGGKESLKKQIYDQYVEFVEDLVKACERGEVVLPDDLFHRMDILPVLNSFTENLDRTAPTKWTDDLLRQLVIEVDKLRDREEISIKNACLKLRGESKFGDLSPIDNLYYRGRKL